MTDAVTVALISTAGLIAVAGLNWLGNRRDNRRLGQRIADVATTTEVVREQVQNSHGTNFRDDHDELRAEVREVLSEIVQVRARQDSAARAVVVVSRKIDAVGKRLDEHIDGGA